MEGTFSGAGNRTIFWRAWLPDAEPAALVVVAHGVCEHSGRYEHVAADLVAHGYGVYALDHRGHGRSDGPRALIDGLDAAVADLRSFVSLARDRHPGARVFLLGHSMGGTLALSYAIRHQDDLDGLILSGPAAALETASPLTRLLARTVSALAPRLGVFGVDTAGVSKDPAVVRAYEEDPLVHHGKVPARTVAELAEAIAAFPDQLPALKLQLLVLHGGDDELVPVEASRTVHDLAGSANKRVEVYPGLAHEILNEPQKADVLADIRGWLAEAA